MDTKRCTKCKQEKLLIEFYKQKYGHQSWCKSCKAAQLKQKRAQREIKFNDERRLMPTYGETHHHAKLTTHDVTLIRLLLDDGMSCVEVGRKFEVSRTTISAIKNYRSWWRI